ncbi:membrane hypothetical protein [Microbacterium sp. 8M]|uniref:hypothetical protein n=1 Tax=Microbacterium sp. 8M TaxID=2653153 RepID=UPI0012F096CA|nr:hypothetical protein [Microbacterium sp. 8M]VXC21731.1 membrane hypothetical protein [Microbacterium sp. 8M]
MSKVRLAFDLHRENATFAGVVVMIWVAAAILTRALAGGPPRAVSASVGILLLVTLQAFAGFRHLTAVHVPLGTVVITLSVLATVRIWRWQPRQAATPGPTASRP